MEMIHNVRIDPRLLGGIRWCNSQDAATPWPRRRCCIIQQPIQLFLDRRKELNNGMMMESERLLTNTLRWNSPKDFHSSLGAAPPRSPIG